MDMSRKISAPLLGEAHYFVIIMENCTTVSSMYFTAQKTKFIDCLRAYKILAENESRGTQSLFAVRLDNAGKQTTNDVRWFINDYRMNLEHSLPYTNQSNGASERIIQEL